MNVKQEKNKEKASPKKKKVRVLSTLAVLFLGIILSITFSYAPNMPTWSEIGYYLFGTVPKEVDNNYVRFIDVGQGDSVLINSKGKTALIDLGPESNDGVDLVRDLHKFGVYNLDCVIISHFDSDHIGGDAVLSRMKIGNIVMPETNTESGSKNTVSFDEFDFGARKSGANIYLAQVGTAIEIGDFTLTVIAYYPDSEDSNDASVMVMAEIEDRKFLFTGDASSKTEQRLLDEGYLLDCDVFKASHHGSRNSNSLEFLKAISPTYTVVSCSEGNTYGHPHSEVLSNLNTVGSLVYRTDIKGNITFYVENGNINVETEK